MIFDSHAHYDDKAFDEDRVELLSSFRKNGIGYVVDPGSDMKSSAMSVELSGKYDFIYSAIGLHPDAVEENNSANMEWLRNTAVNNSKVVAIGEIGLDYYYEHDNWKQQKDCFEAQIEVAADTKLPIIVHSRDAAQDTFDIIKSLDAGKNGGVIHCFSYSVEMAEKFLDFGFYIGVGGVLTFNNSRKLKEVVEHVPLDRIVLETDCPYLSPVPNRGKRNSSLNLQYVIKEISDIKNITENEIIDVTCKNALHMYKINE